MPPVGFETTISAGERPKGYALDRAANGTGATTPKHEIKELQNTVIMGTAHKLWEVLM